MNVSYYFIIFFKLINIISIIYLYFFYFEKKKEFCFIKYWRWMAEEPERGCVWILWSGSAVLVAGPTPSHPFLLLCVGVGVVALFFPFLFFAESNQLFHSEASISSPSIPEWSEESVPSAPPTYSAEDELSPDPLRASDGLLLQNLLHRHRRQVGSLSSTVLSFLLAILSE